jgi:hypothetical protein
MLDPGGGTGGAVGQERAFGYGGAAAVKIGVRESHGAGAVLGDGDLRISANYSR